MADVQHSFEPPEAEGLLDVGDGHHMRWAAYGNPSGKPAAVVHGGPGSMLSRSDACTRELGVLLGATKPLYHVRFFIKPSSTAFETADFGFRTGSYASILF